MHAPAAALTTQLLLLLLTLCSVDSAELRAAEAAARLRDYGGQQAAAAAGDGASSRGGLPSALDAFGKVSGSGCVAGLVSTLLLSCQQVQQQAAAAASSVRARRRTTPAACRGWCRAQVDGRPAFLDPEATRPLAVNETHGLMGAAPGAAAAAAGPKARRGDIPAGEFDISKLAPPMKGQQQ